MIRTIQEKLTELEKEHDFRILFAAESGSRAWGLSSVDSDYDVRFIYTYPVKRYLQLNEPRATYDKVSKNLDFSGWDIKKSLRLFYNGNMSVYEWLHSPIIYKSTHFDRWLTGIVDEYFSPRAAVYHYSNLARKQFLKYVAGNKQTLVKKWFYILRPILAIKWIMAESSCPPIEFSALFEGTKEDLPACIIETVSNLYKLKRDTKEADVVVTPKYFKNWAQKQIEIFWNKAGKLDGRKKDDISELNEVIHLIISER